MVSIEIKDVTHVVKDITESELIINYNVQSKALLSFQIEIFFLVEGIFRFNRVRNNKKDITKPCILFSYFLETAFVNSYSKTMFPLTMVLISLTF